MDPLSASVSGMRAAALGVASVAGNVANVNTPGYRPRRVDFQELLEGGVEVASVREEGGVPPEGMSGVDLASESTDLLGYAATYEANLKVLDAQDEVLGTAMDLLV